jgi:hypothetical protein
VVTATPPSTQVPTGPFVSVEGVARADRAWRSDVHLIPGGQIGPARGWAKLSDAVTATMQLTRGSEGAAAVVSADDRFVAYGLFTDATNYAADNPVRAWAPYHVGQFAERGVTLTHPRAAAVVDGDFVATRIVR